MTDEQKVMKQLVEKFKQHLDTGEEHAGAMAVGECLLLSAFLNIAPRDRFIKAAEQAYDFAATIRTTVQ